MTCLPFPSLLTEQEELEGGEITPVEDVGLHTLDVSNTATALRAKVKRDLRTADCSTRGWVSGVGQN